MVHIFELQKFLSDGNYRFQAMNPDPGTARKDALQNSAYGGTGLKGDRRLLSIN
jgi:hypothetical protein